MTVAAAKPQRASALRAATRIQKALGGLLRELDHQARRARAGKVTGVHALRTTVRRLRAVVMLAEPLLPATATALVVEDLAWLGDVSGSLRDLDVLGAMLADLRRPGSPIVGRGLAHLCRHVAQVRAAAHASFVEALDGDRFPRLEARVAALAKARVAGGGRDIGGASDLVRPPWRSLRRAGRRLASDPSPEALHRVRVRVKQLRYALESAGKPRAGDTAKVCRRLVALQRLLGTHHDAVAQRSWLQTEVPALSSHPEALVALGVVDERLRRRARRAARAVPEAWRRLERPRLMAGMLRELAQRRDTGEPRA